MIYKDNRVHGPNLEHPSAKCFVLYKSKALLDA